MKGIMVALQSLILLTACGDKNVFMGRHNVASGDYYLTFSAGNVHLLIDDPQILKKYQQELRIEKAPRTKTCTNPMQVLALSLLCAIPHYQADHSLKLMHKKKGLIRKLKYGETYHLPPEMDHNVKILGATETWGSADGFIKRVEYLKNLKGISTVKADTPPYSHLVNIYFPLRIEPLAEDYQPRPFRDDFSKAIENNLRERLSQELEKRGITDYQVTQFLHEEIHEQIYDRRIQSSINVIRAAQHYDFDSADYIYVAGYRGDLFSMQVNCDALCVEQVKETNPLNWLPSPVSKKEFLHKLKAAIERNGLTFNAEHTINGPLRKLSVSYFSNVEYYDYILGGVSSSKRRFDLAEDLKLSWQYDLQYAFNHSAAELAKPIIQPILEHRSN